MINKKTLEYLTSKAWYRALKVFYIFLFIVICTYASLLFLGDKVLDIPNSKIICQYGNERQFLVKEIFNKDEMPTEFPVFYYDTDLEFYNNAHGKIGTSEFTQKVLQKCEINEKSKEIFLQQNELAKYFSYILPYSIEEATKRNFSHLFLSLFIIVITFEVIRRIFYYIVLGTITPKK